MTKLESVTLSYPGVVKNLRAPSATAKKINLRFVELLGRSNFSFLQGASHAEEMVEQAILHDYKGISICDLDGFYGIARGYQAYKNPSHFVASADVNKDFKYLIGSEVTFTDHNPIVLMPLNKKGYVDLCAILTLGKRQAAKGHSRLKLSDIKNKTDDLLAFPIPPWTPEGVEALQEIFADRLYLPVWRDLTWESLQFCKQAFQLETEKGVSLFVSQRPFMHTPERKSLFDVMTCILHGKKIRECGDILVQNKERHLRDLNSLYELWKDRPDLLEKTWEIANRVNFSLSEIRYRYPRSNMPEGANATTYLKILVEKGLEERYPHGISDKVNKQVASELALIADLEYEDYFLTLKEICVFAKEKNILFQGRGSAANSVVCFALGLTSVDPMKFDLLFERFLSKERGEPPDIDIDFEHERREEVIQHIYKKYGEQHAAMVCTVIRYKTRMSFRETAKVFGVPLEHFNKMVKYMGREGIKKLV
ncbi:MAG: PHP domain-containing protein, partial [Pseudobdellovibrionaceae bacterium]